MKELDTVELITDRKRYNDAGVFKGMQGVIMDNRRIGTSWLVVFDGRPFDCDGIAVAESIDISVLEKDLKVVEAAKK